MESVFDLDRQAKFWAGYGTTDKVLKLLQWGSKFLVVTNFPANTEQGAALMGLFKACVLHRKAFRLGNIFNNLKALRALLSQGPGTTPDEWLAKVVLQISWIGYFLCDNMV